MAETLETLQISIQLETDRLKQQLDGVTRQVEALGGHMSSETAHVKTFGESLKAVGKAAIEFAMVAEAFNFLKESAQVAVENQKSFAIFALTMKNATGATKEHTAAVDKQLEAMGEMGGVLLPQMRQSFDKLLLTTKNSDEALKMQSLAMDVAAGTHRNLTGVSQLLARAMNGSTGALARLVPSIKNSKTPLQDLAKMFHGAAKAAADANPYARLQVLMEKIKVELGKALVPLLNVFVKILGTVMPVVSMVADLLAKLIKVLDPLISRLWKSLNPLFQSLATLLVHLITAVLPPLMQIIDKVFLPLLDAMVVYLNNYVIPLWTKVADVLGVILVPIVNTVVSSFQLLMMVLGPLYETIIKPMLDALMALLGIKVEPVIAPKVDTSNMGDLAGLATGNLDSLGANAGKTSGSAKTATSSLNSQTNAMSKFLNTVLAANDRFNADVIKAVKSRNDAMLKLDAEHASKVADIQAAFNDKMNVLIQQSEDQLRSVFADATKLDVGGLFIGAGASVDNLILMLKDKLMASKKLADDAAALSGAGFSQTFIEQIVALGPAIGDQLAQQLLLAGPDAQSSVQSLFDQVNTVSAHGMDTLAQTIYTKSGLATEALRSELTKANSELVVALDAENASYEKSGVTLQKKFNDTMVKLNATRNAAISKAVTALNDALGTTAHNLDDALTLVKNSVAGKSDKIKSKIDALNTSLQTTHDILKNLPGDWNTATGQLGATTTGGTPRGGSSGGTVVQQQTNNVNVQTQSNASANDIANATVNAIKYGTTSDAGTPQKLIAPGPNYRFLNGWNASRPD